MKVKYLNQTTVTNRKVSAQNPLRKVSDLAQPLASATLLRGAQQE